MGLLENIAMSLDIVITQSPFIKPIDEENFDTGRYISIDEWDELFHNVLGVPEIERHIDESREDFLKKRKRLFEQIIMERGYEMLGRIWYVFRDAFYAPSEVNKLLSECLEIQHETTNKMALSALESLIFACKQALKVDSGIWLISD
jgi:hypothetical protein